MKRPSVLVIFLTVFLDLIGFGIVVPLVPLFSRELGAQGFTIGVVIAAFSAMQFVFAPIWGRLSDRIGRRPVLLISTLGAAISYALFALSCGLQPPGAALGLMLLSRVLAGICGGNITVAQAYLADITPPADRSRRMGLIGMAFGLGFIFGPILGGISLKHFGATGPGWTAAALCAGNFLLALTILAESRRSTSPVPARPHLDQWLHTLRTPRVGLLVVVFFLATFCFSCFESTLPLLVSDNFHLEIGRDEASAATVVWLFAYCGIIGAVIQGGAIGQLVRRWGEPRLIVFSLGLTAASFAVLPFIKGPPHLSWSVLWQPDGLAWWIMLGALGALAVGSSLTRPPLFGLLSNLTHEHEQGANIGVAQGAGSLARILGPLFANTTLHYLPPLPYLTCALVLSITAAVFALKMLGMTLVASGAAPARARRHS